jgi:hypothetical protein
MPMALLDCMRERCSPFSSDTAWRGASPSLCAFLSGGMYTRSWGCGGEPMICLTIWLSGRGGPQREGRICTDYCHKINTGF